MALKLTIDKRCDFGPAPVSDTHTARKLPVPKNLCRTFWFAPGLMGPVLPLGPVTTSVPEV